MTNQYYCRLESVRRVGMDTGFLAVLVDLTGTEVPLSKVNPGDHVKLIGPFLVGDHGILVVSHVVDGAIYFESPPNDIPLIRTLDKR